VRIADFSFGPTALTVPIGTTVTVVSTDEPKIFKSNTDEKFSFTFSKAGTYLYFCSIHPKMTAKVIVQ